MIQARHLTKIITAMTMALAPVPAKSLGYQDVPLGLHTSSAATTLQELPENTVTFIPVADATLHIKSLTERMRSHLRYLNSVWEETGSPFILEHQSTFFQENFHYLSERVEESKILITAVRTALAAPSEADEETRSQLLAFGRAVASYRHAVEGIFNFIESTHPPAAVSSDAGGIDAMEVKAMIAAEHKSMGLEPPIFH
ncbi:hypothetical protein [Serratia bockelmannii]|uniref:hypothetical protein n=1 Tax=Serratia bockelmannii TaxID=2703793 RepID=UPI003FA6DDB3